jgi:hypothetical protein
MFDERVAACTRYIGNQPHLVWTQLSGGRMHEVPFLDRGPRLN